MPNRIIKESICTSNEIDALKPEEELFFYRIIVNCDDYGRMDARLPILRAKCFPLRIDKVKDKDIKAWINSLVAQNLIFLYTVDGKRYLQMTTWEKHQQVRAKRSKFPAPDDGVINKIADETVDISSDSNGNQMQSDVPENPIQSNIESESNPIEKPSPTPYQNIIDLYHKYCPSLPKIRTITDKRKDTMRVRWRTYSELSVYEELFKKAEASDFLSGRSGKWTGCNFDWLMNESNMIKVLEGNYDNKRGEGNGRARNFNGNNRPNNEQDDIRFKYE